MNEIYCNENRVEQLKKRKQRCCCKYCGREFGVKTDCVSVILKMHALKFFVRIAAALSLALKKKFIIAQKIL